MSDVAYIYLIGTTSKRGDFPVLCKVGRSNDFRRRYEDICGAYARVEPRLPFSIHGIRAWSCAAADAPEIEKHIHAVLAEYRYMGEWFNLPIDVQRTLADDSGALKCKWPTKEAAWSCE